MRSPSVIISVLAHGAVIGVAIVAPLLASDTLPPIPSPIASYIRAFRPADIPLPAEKIAKAPSPHRGAPTVAPVGIIPEKPRPPEYEGPTLPSGTEGLTTSGLPADFGGSEIVTPIPPPPPTRPTVPAVTNPLPVGGRIRTPNRLSYVTPIYPAIAISAHIEGDVMLEAIIGVDGSVQDLRVVRSVQLLDEAALAAVRRWRYTPTLLNGVPVPVVVTVTVSFRLSK